MEFVSLNITSNISRSKAAFLVNNKPPSRRVPTSDYTQGMSVGEVAASTRRSGTCGDRLMCTPLSKCDVAMPSTEYEFID